MGRSIVQQPNGQLAVWSTIVDNFIVTNATKEQLIEYFLEGERVTYTAAVNDESRYKPYEECLKEIERVHGKKEKK